MGAGPSGLVAAKHALAQGLKPIIFEQNPEIGGVWNPTSGSVWKNMTTNLSKYTCSFEDMAWSEDTPAFPSSSQMFEYLGKYATHFGIMPHIKFNSTVTNVKPNEQGGYDITWNQEASHTTMSVDYVVVATGIFAEGYIPQIEGLESFTGNVMHTKDYKDGSTLSGQKVLVIGGSLSGAEVVGDVAEYTSVTHSFRDPFWILSRYIPKDPSQQAPKYPLDLVFYNRKFYESTAPDTKEEGYSRKNKYMSALCQKQQKDGQLKVSESDYTKPVKIAISDKYMPNVEKGSIKPLKAVVTKFEGGRAIFSNGEEESFDTVIMATGFRVNLSYLDPTIQEKIKYTPEDQLQPTILYNTTFHNELPNMAFVGVYKGPYFAVMEHQAKWAIGIASGNLRMPDHEEVVAGLQKEQEVRELVPRLQFPHADYVNFADTVARLAGNDLDLQKLKIENPEMYAQYIQMTVLPGSFTLGDIEGQMARTNEILETSALGETGDI